ncbi:MAG TPA: peptide chain release factor 1 [Spirochaetota bacterium]|nr:peptide chain release factor 1 [Spirochaetota bacterium]HOR44654.1 peptide chain release factor 1 [Spirochaetota bacterium]HPK56099.1 peptide chain release factor 1 [Spirochaetota bacterium]HPW52115.1 peptide chain release factor 1 [Spirochaetota bacterium]
MEARLERLNTRFNELQVEMSNPSVVSNQEKFRELSREFSQLEPAVKKYKEYVNLKKNLSETEVLLQTEKDPEMRSMLTEEKHSIEENLPLLEKEMMVLLLPKDPGSGKDVIMEIRAGTGGDEAALFVSDLFRMYSRYADINKWKLEIMEKSETEIGGFKEIIFSISGDAAYDDLKFESGTHRVQRIPSTEAGGRIHTSAVTVAVMPEAEESDVNIRTEDLRIDVYRSSGSGGQHVNTTDSAVRITHIPSGLVVTSQDERSQIKNKAKALRVLRTRLFEVQDQKRRETESKLRKSQVGSGDRSERIRTYNFPQSRVTDHRIGVTLYNLETFLNGEMHQIIKSLKEFEIEELLKDQDNL